MGVGDEAAELAALRVAHAQTRKALREAEERLNYIHEVATIARIAPDRRIDRTARLGARITRTPSTTRALDQG